MRFKDRREAGQKLADALEQYKGKDVVIYALPRGGVALGVEVAKRLNAPLDLVITRKVSHPSNPEYGICVVAEHKSIICNEEEIAHIDQKWLKNEIEKQRQEAQRRRKVYLQDRKRPSVKGKIAIVVDDGVATGLTLLLAIQELKHLKPKRIIAAVPVTPRDTAKKIKEEADELVALNIPFMYLGAVGAYYEEFSQVEDEEVIKLLSDPKLLRS